METSSTGVCLYCPIQFKATNLPHRLRKYADHARYLLHTIIIQGHKQGDQDRWARLDSQLLQLFIPSKHYTSLRKALVDAGFIEIHHGYRVGTRCKRYRLLEPYNEQPIVRIEVTNKALAKRMIQSRLLRHGKAIKPEELDEVERHLRLWQSRVDINLVACCETIKDVGGTDYSKCYSTMCVQDIDAKDWEFSIDNYGRVHTNFTRLLSECRQHLSIKGKKLVNIDIRNSQMVFLAMYIIEKHLHVINGDENSNNSCYKHVSTKQETKEVNGNNNVSTNKENKEVKENNNAPKEKETKETNNNDKTRNGKRKTQTSNNNQQKGYDNGKGTTPTPISTVNQNPSYPIKGTVVKYNLVVQSMNSDLRLFIDKCFDGTLYNYLMEKSGWQGDRSSFKKEAFKSIFYGRSVRKYPRGKYDFAVPSSVRNTFIDLFPSVWEFICAEKKNDHADLPKQMQTRESNFMIRAVCQRLMERHPEVPVITIHDSIMTTEDCVDIVKRLILEEFQYVGVTAQVKVGE